MLYALPQHTDPPSALELALSDLRKIISYRIQSHFDEQDVHSRQQFNEQFNAGLIQQPIRDKIPQLRHPDEWIILLLALTPHISPDFFESIMREFLPAGGDFPVFGGVKATNHRGMLPTGETAQFILAGTNIEERLRVHRYFAEDHFFFRQNILWLEPVKEGEPLMSGRIILAEDTIDKILLNKESAPRFGLDFPAKRIKTEMNRDDMVLNRQTARQVNDIGIWLQHHHYLFEDENLKRKVKPGYRVLFYGPSGTGKTLTAALLGKEFQKEVYRVDLSQIVSKYIGETEKNLESVFRRAESKDWILFFDEADALFGKRTNVQSSHDKYANQEVSYLLQRVEDYPGLLILASNFKSNLDEAFIRRFHSVIHFPMPNTAERHLLWQKAMPVSLPPDDTVDLQEFAKQYEMSGAAILNAVQFATLSACAAGQKNLSKSLLVEGVRKEFIKEEKSV